MENKKIRLKPIVYSSNRYVSGSQNTAQQMFLLKALQVTQDPKKLRDIIQVRTVAEVYRTLDKLTMRKEFHEALSRAGISFDYIVGGIKTVADKGFKDSDKLKALQVLLKSVGMDEYKESSLAMTGTWEEVLLKKIEEGKATDKPLELAAPIQYEVKRPLMPESAKKMEDEEKELTSSIYENNK